MTGTIIMIVAVLMVLNLGTVAALWLNGRRK
jgi:hypothetical protein